MKKYFYTLIPIALLLFVITIFAKGKSKTSTVNLKEQTLIAVRDSTSNMADFSKKFSASIQEAYTFAMSNKLNVAGGPICMTLSYSPDKYVFLAAISVTNATAKPNGRIFIQKIPACKAVKYVHIGSYDKLGDAYNEIMKLMQAKKWQQNGYSWEQYMNDPGNTAPEKLETHIYFPIK
jgi:effector-binding domain-containing protein